MAIIKFIDNIVKAPDFAALSLYTWLEFAYDGAPEVFPLFINITKRKYPITNPREYKTKPYLRKIVSGRDINFTFEATSENGGIHWKSLDQEPSEHYLGEVKTLIALPAQKGWVSLGTTMDDRRNPEYALLMRRLTSKANKRYPIYYEGITFIKYTDNLFFN